ncbi:hypothetical protein EDC96DRAFT_546038 [Choanephora cucurbitarum]|nr:hypothetical protein EDC96DRAFT_546038 [Choanephora cucurbitarum]
MHAVNQNDLLDQYQCDSTHSSLNSLFLKATRFEVIWQRFLGREIDTTLGGQADDTGSVRVTLKHKRHSWEQRVVLPLRWAITAFNFAQPPKHTSTSTSIQLDTLPQSNTISNSTSSTSVEPEVEDHLEEFVEHEHEHDGNLWTDRM